MPRFGMTGKVLAKADRDVDPYQHIDRVREEVYEHLERLEALEREVQALKNANVTRYTDSGIWKVVKIKLDEKAVDWMVWAARALLVGFGGVLIKAIEWMIRKAMNS